MEKIENVIVGCLLILSIFALFQLITDINIAQEWALSYFPTDQEKTVDDMYEYFENEKEYGRFRIDSLLGFSFDYGYYSGVLGLFVLYLYYRDHKKIWLFVSLLLGLGGALLCGSRSSLLSAFVGYAMLIFIHTGFNIKKLFIPICAFVISLFYLQDIPIVEGLVDVFTSGGDNSTGSSKSMRMDQLAASIFFFLQSPIWGNGFGYIENAAPDNYMKAMILGSESIIFTILVQSGIIGFLYWTTFLFSWFRAFKKHMNLLESQVGLSLFGSFIVYSFATGVQGSLFITLPMVSYLLVYRQRKIEKMLFAING